MAEDRVEQVIIEIATPHIVDVRETQTVIEVAAPPVIENRQTQQAVEILSPIQVNVRQTQNIIEVIMPGIPDVSGIYFINPNKAEWHDSFYGDRSIPGSPGIERKIPDPRVRIAYLGD